ncbi:guanine deaminase [Brachybacterium avium]|uniref:Guanine deaminase n=1 Tax=Brachybacterium avium TaxID=2017485 RepID=A0A220UDX8_9MICO|nr:guanine deaminase [Brachybacterium avium]ASK66305.1 guanine deaminase [Brachybacterium avium]
MPIYLATVLDTPGDLGEEDGLRADTDLALVVRDGVIVARTDLDSARRDHPAETLVDLRDGILLPGFVDTHVHFPQVRVIGGLGRPLLDWLAERALPEEARLADVEYARGVAADFLSGLTQAGTTTAMVFGSHFPRAVDALFEQAERSGHRITTGLVLSDRLLREDLLQTPAAALEASRELARRWHGRGRLRYAITPRFSLSTTDEMLAAAGSLLTGDELGTPRDLWFTSHLNENDEEIAQVRELFPAASGYLDTYTRHGLVTERSVFAHNVHPEPAELAALAAAGAAVAHCPSSNGALGSGLFPLRAHLEAGVRIALGTDVGAGTGFSLLKEGLQAYLVQQLSGREGITLSAADLLHLATRSGALALGLADQVGDLSVGKQFDAVRILPPQGSTLGVALHHTETASDALATLFAQGTPADIHEVWVAGQEIKNGPSMTTVPADEETAA